VKTEHRPRVRDTPADGVLLEAALRELQNNGMDKAARSDSIQWMIKYFVQRMDTEPTTEQFRAAQQILDNTVEDITLKDVVREWHKAAFKRV
jgi:hypothetical protein